MKLKLFCFQLALLSLLAGCISNPPRQVMDASAPIGHASLPVYQGWYDGRAVYYLITDVTDATFALGMGANLSSRLVDTLSARQGPAGLGKATERVYVTEDPQQAKIFASAPRPIGPESRDQNYSPVWQVYAVQWSPSATRRQLRSEEDVLSAQEQGVLSVTPTNSVINCPIVGEVKGNNLPGVLIQRNAW